MTVRLVEGGVAAGFGALDALVTAKVTKSGPAGIPYPVILEGAGILAGMFGDKVGVPTEVRDPLLLASLALAGARVTRVAMSGKLMQGPAAWGGMMLADAGTGGHAATAATRAQRQLPARGGMPGGWYPPVQEPAGIAG